MKKFFALCAVALFAVAVNAEVIFSETYVTKRGDSYIQKTEKGYWPYASQWFTGYDAENGKKVEGNQYDNAYTKVSSYTVSIRGKKLNGSTAKESSCGLYFAAGKEGKDNYVKFEGALPKVEEGKHYLHFEVCSTEADGGNLDAMIIQVNDQALTVPQTELGKQYMTSIVTVALPTVEMASLYFAFNNVPSQKFINRFWIDTSADLQGIEEVVITEQSQKVMVDGVVYIVRDGKMYDLMGTQVR